MGWAVAVFKIEAITKKVLSLAEALQLGTHKTEGAHGSPAAVARHERSGNTSYRRTRRHTGQPP